MAIIVTLSIMSVYALPAILYATLAGFILLAWRRQGV